MTHCQQATTKTRFDFEAFSSPRRKPNRKKAARNRIIKRTVHFLGFLVYWATLLIAAELGMLCALIAFISLS